MTPISASFSDFKLIRTRQVVQLIFEIPVEAAEQALHLLGMPSPAKETWVGIVPLNSQPVLARQSTPEGIKAIKHIHACCDDPLFRGWIQAEGSADEAMAMVKAMMKVDSLTELHANTRPWDDLFVQFKYRENLP